MVWITWKSQGISLLGLAEKSDCVILFLYNQKECIVSHLLWASPASRTSMHCANWRKMTYFCVVSAVEHLSNKQTKFVHHHVCLLFKTINVFNRVCFFVILNYRLWSFCKETTLQYRGEIIDEEEGERRLAKVESPGSYIYFFEAHNRRKMWQVYLGVLLVNISFSIFERRKLINTYINHQMVFFGGNPAKY